MIHMKRIYLIGFMGSGKSTVGLYLQHTFAQTFIDTDQYIEQTRQKEISQIFADEGEDQFRQYEIQALQSLLDFDVIATGGGIVERKENYKMMHSNGVIIYLQTSFPEIMSRLKYDSSRPLWDQQITEREKLYERRHTMYKNIADHIIHTDGLHVEEIGKEIMGIMKQE